MKRFFGILLVTALLWFGPTTVRGETTPLTTLDFNIVGIGLNAGPDYQAVPKGIATHVSIGVRSQYRGQGYTLTK